MKILHLIPSYLPAYEYGGPIFTVHQLNKHLREKGNQVTVLTTKIKEKTFKKPTIIDGVQVFYLKSDFGPWFYSRELNVWLKNNLEKFDILHITSVFLYFSYIGRKWAEKKQVPFIISPRGSLMKNTLFSQGFKKYKKLIYLSLIEKKNLEKAKVIHFTSKKEKEEYQEIGLPDDKGVIIPNGIEFRKIKPEISFRKKFNIGNNKKIILFLGRLNWKKGIDLLIPAFSKITIKNPEAILVFIGPDDGYLSKAKNLVNKFKLNNKVLFLGPIFDDFKISAFLESDVFVLPSYSENFGQAALEAISYGLPTIISTEVGLSEFMENKKHGLIIKPNKKDLETALFEILNNQKLKEKIKTSSKDLVKKFSWSEISEEFLNLYQSLIN